MEPLTEAELEAEIATELPDRELLSIASPVGLSMVSLAPAAAATAVAEPADAVEALPDEPA